MNFGYALDRLQMGAKVSRSGWNGKGMWLKLKPPGAHPADMTVPFIFMKTADDQLVPWLASQTDVLAQDWSTVD